MWTYYSYVDIFTILCGHIYNYVDIFITMWTLLQLCGHICNYVLLPQQGSHSIPLVDFVTEIGYLLPWVSKQATCPTVMTEQTAHEHIVGF